MFEAIDRAKQLDTWLVIGDLHLGSETFFYTLRRHLARIKKDEGFSRCVAIIHLVLHPYRFLLWSEIGLFCLFFSVFSTICMCCLVLNNSRILKCNFSTFDIIRFGAEGSSKYVLKMYPSCHCKEAFDSHLSKNCVKKLFFRNCNKCTSLDMLFQEVMSLFCMKFCSGTQ